ncbi:protein KIBRA-like [Tubulanus polymorphus]|uniref:protein KIBRA-like n=1 Tax=Tubulanus polymorphus TaxID=672921 RepID=UPI003DA5A9B2
MPRNRNGELSLPDGWELGQDYDGKLFYIDHNTRQTTWIDPRDRFTKPHSFADCSGDELPLGWEEVYDSSMGVYYIDHINKTNQLEDPRLQWRIEQEKMLKDYLVTAHEDLAAKKEIYNVKQQRLTLAQDEYLHLNETLTQNGWKTSRTSLNSCSSVGSTKYDPDLLKADVALAKNRVSRLKREIEQIRAEMQYKQQGVDTLSQVDEKMSGQASMYNINEAQEIRERIKCIQKSLISGQKEKQNLMHSLAKLKDDILMNKLQSGSSPDVSTLSLPCEKSNMASQTDLSGDGLSSGARLAEIARMGFLYDEAKKNVNNHWVELAKIEQQIIPGQSESDKDRLLLIQEKEQLLRELRGMTMKGRRDDANVLAQIHQLELDLNTAMEMSSRQIAERLKVQETKALIRKKLEDAIKAQTFLETQLRSLSLSTLSASSGSSLGSLGSLSATSSKGSQSSLSFTDIYGQHHQTDTNIQDMNRIYHVLQGHSISPINELQTTSATPDEQFNVVARQPISLAIQPIADRGLLTVAPAPSSQASISPPVSPLEIGPPPTYQQHMTMVVQQRAGTADQNNTEQCSLQSQFMELQLSAKNTAAGSSSNVDFNNHANAQAVSNNNNISNTPVKSVSPHSPLTPDSIDSGVCMTGVLRQKQPSGGGDAEPSNLPPLSPISETSSGVCNNMSGGLTTRSVSAAVSDESVAGDSGVFEASINRPGALDDVLVLNLECAQVQVKLRYEQFEKQLIIGIEQARNLAALPMAENSQVCIKTALLPSPPGQNVFTTLPSGNLNCPKFNHSFRVNIPENRLFTKTLQVNIWCLQSTTAYEECLGCAQVSLADFDPAVTLTRWYNVLSFKFMQSDCQITSMGSQTSVCSQNSLSEKGCMDQSLKTSSTLKQRSVVVPEAGSAENIKDSTHRSSHPHISSLKEESSDESTIISSQPSTLTRNQDPDEMERHKCGSPPDGEEVTSSQDEAEDEGPYDEEAEEIVSSELDSPSADLPSGYEVKYSDDADDDADMDGGDLSEEEYSDRDEDAERCDKETNTERNYQHATSWSKKHADDTMHSSTIRRSQTFSPAGDAHGHCKLNRRGSDSLVPLYRRGPFQRNSKERRSLRWKKPPCTMHRFKTPKDRNRVCTSLDLELDLQASQTKLTQLKDEIGRLQELIEKMRQAKESGQSELPSWFTENERLLELLQEAESLSERQDQSPPSTHQRKVDRLLKKVNKEVHKLRKIQSANQKVDVMSFREKIAFFTTVHMDIPVITTDSETEGATIRNEDHG